MASKIDIFNMALSHTGTSQTVADELERSVERVTCSRFYDTARDALLSYKDMPWNFAITTVALADLGSPPTNWQYRYRYPNDCINALQLVVDGMRNLPENYRPPFQIEWEADGRVILTDQGNAVLAYVKRITEAERYPSPFVEALAMKLASLIVMPLKNDPNMAQLLAQQAEGLIQVAMASSLNEAQPDPAPRSAYETEMHGGPACDYRGRF
jgi:hypothetical protein